MAHPCLRTQRLFRSAAALTAALLVYWCSPAAADSGCANMDALVVAVDPEDSSTIYLGGRLGLVVSHDGGQTWANPPKGDLLGVSAIAMSKSAPKTVYLGTDLGGLFESVDSGKTWQDTGIGFRILPCPSAFPCVADLDIQSIAIDASNPLRLLLGTSGGLFEWTVGARAWTRAAAQPGNGWISSILFDPASPGTVYIGTPTGLYQSLDNGNSWTLSSSLAQEFVGKFTVDPTNSSRIYVGTGGGIFRTDDHGQTWTPLNKGLPTEPVLLAMAGIFVDRTDPRVIFAASDMGHFYRSSDGGQNWTTLQGLLPDVVSFAGNPSVPMQLYVATSSSGFFESRDAGNSWQPIPDFGETLTISGISPTSVLVGTGGYQGEPEFILGALGTGFRDGDVLTVNGSPRPTSIVSCVVIAATIFSSDVALPGELRINIVRTGTNPEISNSVSLEVDSIESLRGHRVGRAHRVRTVVRE